MILTKTHAEGVSQRQRYNEPNKTTGSWFYTYFGNFKPEPIPDPSTLYPIAFQIEFDPEHSSDPHFHVADQFQVFVDGEGTLGKTPLGPVSVHYASAYSPYGPLSAGKRGMTYLTLRNGFDPGIHYIATERDLLKAAARRPRGRSAQYTPGPAAPTATSCTTLLAPEADGLAAWAYALAPGASVTGPDPRSGRGQYWVGVRGAGTVAGAAMDRWSCTFCSADEPAQSAVAGPDGLELLVLQFPTYGRG
jgi:hypothetical protein